MEFDIETSTSIGKFFGKIYETNILRVLRQSYMLCFSYKILDEKKIHTFALPDFSRYKKNKQDDEMLVKKLAEILESADIIVGHNGDRFDITMTNTRMLFHSLDPLSPKKTIDTCKEAKRILKLPSNKLGDIGDYYGIGRKKPHTGTALWDDCEDGVYHPAAWEMMREYNAQDVWLLDKVYLKMRPYIRHPNLNLITGENFCPKCQSKNLQARGYRRNLGSEYQRLQCQDCGSWSSGRREVIAKKVHVR